MELTRDQCSLECDERFSFEVKRTEVEASSGLGPCALFHQFHIGMGPAWVNIGYPNHWMVNTCYLIPKTD